MTRHIVYFLLGGLLLGATLLPLGCSKAENPWYEAKPGQKKILVSFPPLYCFAKNVAGDDACVMCLLTTQGPHGYSPSHQDMAKAKNTDLFLINGLELDDFVLKLAERSQNRRAGVVKVADAIPHEYLLHNEHGDDAKGHEEGRPREHGEHDPHVWLHPEFAQKMVDKIATQFSSLDPDDAGYKSRAEAYKAELQKLLTDGNAALAGKKNRKLVTQHESLRYFAEAFKLTLLDSIQPRPGMEADARKLAELVKQCREEKVAAICIEPQYSKKAAEALANQLQNHKLTVPLVEVDPLETAPGSPNPDPGYYLQRMRQNIDNLAKGASMNPLIRLRGVGVSLGNVILRGVQGDIARGQITALVGLNGSGKTTLLRALLHEIPYTGAIEYFCGHDHRQPRPEYVGYVPQRLRIDANLPLTVEDLLALALSRRPLFFGIRKKQRAEMIDLLGLVGASPDLLTRPVDKLSGGELQRVLLGLACYPKPELLLLDEPAAGIDFQDQEKFYALIARLNRERGVTILLVSHDIAVVTQHAHQVLCLSDGVIKCQGPPNDALTTEQLQRTFGTDKGLFHHAH